MACCLPHPTCAVVPGQGRPAAHQHQPQAPTALYLKVDSPHAPPPAPFTPPPTHTHTLTSHCPCSPLPLLTQIEGLCVGLKRTCAVVPVQGHRAIHPHLHLVPHCCSQQHAPAPQAPGCTNSSSSRLTPAASRKVSMLQASAGPWVGRGVLQVC